MSEHHSGIVDEIYGYYHGIVRGIANINVREMCENGVNIVVETVQDFPKKLQERILSISRHASDRKEDIDETDSEQRLAALRVISTNLKHYWIEFGE